MPRSPLSTPTNTDVGLAEHGHKRRTPRAARTHKQSLQPAETNAVEATLVSSTVDDPGDHAESAPHVAMATPPQTSAAGPLSEDVGAWLPRVRANYLTRGPQGIWYLRWLVPVKLRAWRPDLPRELRRSTETANKRLVAGRARKMCSDFFTSAVNSGSTMQQPGVESRLTFRIVFEDGALRAEAAQTASADTLILMSNCLRRVVLQVVGRGCREPTQVNSAPSAAPGSLALWVGEKDKTGGVLPFRTVLV